MNIKNVTSPCIYMAVNKINGKRYIGKSVNFQARYKKHKYAKYYNTYFHNAIRKYEFENFEWSILEENLPINLLILALYFFNDSLPLTDAIFISIQFLTSPIKQNPSIPAL